MRELFVDNFAGGGGASTGIEIAIGRSVDIAINHDPDAIAMHRANHPLTKHYCEDVWQVDPEEACDGIPVALAWFSPDCKHFSRAKGGKPKDQNIRGLAWVAVKWAYAVRPRVIMLENVPEIKSWGPLGEDNKPIKDREGETFEGFILALTSGIPVSHPAFSEMCNALSIAPTSETAIALTRGLGYDIEYRVLKSCDYGAPTSRSRFYMIGRCDGKKIVWPAPTHGPKNSKAVKTGSMLPYNSVADCIDWRIPMKSIFDRKKPLAENTLSRIAIGFQKYVVNNPEPYIVSVNHSGERFRGQRINEPLATVTAKHGYALVSSVLVNYDANPVALGHSLQAACIMKNYAGRYNGTGQDSLNQLSSFTDKDHNCLVTAHLVTLRRNMIGQPIDEPLTTISCKPHHAAVIELLQRYVPGKGESVDESLPIVTIHGRQYVVVDIQMRMLEPRELFNAQGFPWNYMISPIINGKPYSKAKQTARCGNAVTPAVPAALVRANLPEHCESISSSRKSASFQTVGYGAVAV